MNILNFGRGKKKTYSQTMFPVYCLLMIFGLVCTFPSISTNYIFFTTFFGSDEGIIWLFSIMCAVGLDMTKYIILSTCVYLGFSSYFSKDDNYIDVITLVMFLGLQGISTYTSYKGNDLRDKTSHIEKLERIAQKDTISNVINITASLSASQIRQARKIEQSRIKNSSKISEIKKEERQAVENILQHKLQNNTKKFSFVCIVDALSFLCCFCCGYLTAKREDEEETTSDDSKTGSDDEHLKKLQGLYRTYASKGDFEKCTNIAIDIKRLGGKIPKSTIKDD